MTRSNMSGPITAIAVLGAGCVLAAGIGCGGSATSARDAASAQPSPKTLKCSMVRTKLLDTNVLFPPGNLGQSFYALAVTSEVLLVAVNTTVIVQHATNDNCPIPAPGMALPVSCITTTSNFGRIFSVPLRGGAESVLIDNISGGVAGFAVTGDTLVYGMAGDFRTGDHLGTMSSLSLLAGPTPEATPSQLASGIPTAWPGGLSTDGQSVYWPDSDGIHRVPLAGGSTQTLSTRAVSDVRPFGISLLLDDDKNSNVLSLALDASSPTPTTLATGQVNPVGAQGCGTGAVCWSDRGALSGPGSRTAQGAAIMRLDANGQLIVRYQPMLGADILYDGQDLFAEIGDCCSASIVRMAAQSDATPVTIATTNGAGPFTVDDECVYWVDPSLGVFSQNKTSSGM